MRAFPPPLCRYAAVPFAVPHARVGVLITRAHPAVTRACLLPGQDAVAQSKRNPRQRPGQGLGRFQQDRRPARGFGRVLCRVAGQRADPPRIRRAQLVVRAATCRRCPCSRAAMQAGQRGAAARTGQRCSEVLVACAPAPKSRMRAARLLSQGTMSNLWRPSAPPTCSSTPPCRQSCARTLR